MSDLLPRIALLTIVALFPVVESRHANLVEAMVERVTALEKRMVESRQSRHRARGG